MISYMAKANGENKMNNEITPLERWLRKNNLKMYEFAEMIGCHRNTVYAIKKNKAVDETIARKVFFITNSEVQPQIKNRGGQFKNAIAK